MTRRIRGVLLACTLALASGSVATLPARADDRARAQTLFEEAAAARNEGRWEDARALLVRALGAYPHFSIGWNLVTAVERVGDLPEAERLLEWMRDGGVGELSDAERDSIVVRLDEISARLATIVIVAPAAAGDARLDGENDIELDAAGHARIRVNPGTHELAIETRDGRRVERTVEARAGATVRARLEPPELVPTGPTEPVDDGETSVWSSPWLYVGVAAFLVAGAVLAAFLLTDGNSEPVGADFVAPGI
jgi:hypothetical protein